MNRSLRILAWSGVVTFAFSNLWLLNARANESVDCNRPAKATAGDVVVVTHPTSLMVGSKSVAPVSLGQRLTVLDAKEGWIGTWVESSGHKTYGWLRDDFAASSDAVAVAAAPNARRSYSYEPSESPTENAAVMTQPAYPQQSYRSSGRYRTSNRGPSSQKPLYLLQKGDPRRSGGR